MDNVSKSKKLSNAPEANGDKRTHVQPTAASSDDVSEVGAAGAGTAAGAATRFLSPTVSHKSVSLAQTQAENQSTKNNRSPLAGATQSEIYLQQNLGLAPELADTILEGGFSTTNSLHTRVLEHLRSLNIQIREFHDSGGGSCVFLNDNSAHQYYETRPAFEKVKNFPANIEGFVQKTGIDEANSGIVWQRVRPLREVIGSLERDKLQDLIGQAHQALEHLHQAGYVHGDPRLDNLGVDSQDRARWFDFDRSKPSRDPADFEKEMREFQESVRHHGLN